LDGYKSSPHSVYAPVRALLAAIRTFPSILWAILFVIMVGLGPFAGTENIRDVTFYPRDVDRLTP